METARDRLRNYPWLRKMRYNRELLINGTTEEQELRRERALRYFNNVMEKAWGPYAENMDKWKKKQMRSM